MTTNEKAQRIFSAIEHGLMGAGLLALVLIVHTETYNIEAAAAKERAATYQNCRCKPEIKGRQLVASMCQAPTNLGPWSDECIYQKEKQ